jgi:Cd2+/Zn2+-exporting ATPase
MAENETKEPTFKKTLNLTVINNAPSVSAKSCCEDDSCSITTAENEQKDSLASFPVKSGYTREYQIGGMDCPACAVTIEKSIKNIKNISYVTVNYSTGKMQVVSDEGTSLEQIPDEIKKIGFTAEPLLTNGNGKMCSQTASK